MSALLVTVRLETTLGADYLFPDMARDEMDFLLQQLERVALGQLTLVNVSRAALVVPMRVIKKIYIDGGERWVCPA